MGLPDGSVIKAACASGVYGLLDVRGKLASGVEERVL